MRVMNGTWPGGNGRSSTTSTSPPTTTAMATESEISGVSQFTSVILNTHPPRTFMRPALLSKFIYFTENLGFFCLKDKICDLQSLPLLTVARGTFFHVHIAL